MIAPAALTDDFDARDGRHEFPCSQAQLRFWFEEQLHPSNPGLNVAVRWRLEGELSDEHLNEAWRRLIDRHASLRTSFTDIDGEPVQIVAAALPFEVRTIDLRALAKQDVAHAAQQFAQTEAHEPFALEVAPLIRVTRLVLDDTTSELLVTAHHTVCDGWSVGILAHEMGILCAALAARTEPVLPELTVDYGSYAAAERERAENGSLEAETAFARGLLHDYKQFEVLPDLPRPTVQTSNGAIASVLLDRSLTDALARVARDNGCTLFMTALAALATLLHRYSGESDIALGTQVVGRDELELEGVVGCFINTIALRSDLSGDPTFLDLLDRTRDTVTDAFDIRHLPLEALIDIVKPKRDLSRNALFSVNFIYQRSFIENRAYGSFALVDLPSRSAGSLYDLNFFMVERPEGWRIACEYNTDLFENQTVAGMLERFCNVLRTVVDDPAQRISRLAVLSDADVHALVVERNATQRVYPLDETLPQMFAAQAARTPAAIALVCAKATFTYAQLDLAANRLARELGARGLGPGKRAALLLERSPDLVVALLAVLKCGAAYVPLDPAYPNERLAFIAESAGVAVVITRGALRYRLATPVSSFLDIEADAARIAAHRGDPFDIPATPDDIAYVIYTSGSTGRPKGVQIPHRALANFLRSMRERPGLDASDTLVAVTTICFDIAGLEIFLPLISGAKLVLATESEAGDGEALRSLLRDVGATIVQATPVTWNLLIEAGWAGEPRLTILCGGEALQRPLAEQLLSRGDAVWNMYGPTETTIWSAVDRVEPGSGPVPIGQPIANTQFYVLDAQGQLVPPGAPGELYIGGDGVAVGYLDRPDLTLERFVVDPFTKTPGARLYRTGDLVRMRRDGSIDFLGRTDHQIKLRGFRIELGEIESALLRANHVAEAAVVVGEDALGGAAIRAYVTLAPSATLASGNWPATLRAQIAEFLPKYMLPSAIAVLAALPRTPNGKIDRNALPAQTLAPDTARDELRDPPIGETEIRLTELVAALLKCGQIGRGEDFFALGFHSLLAVRLIARISQTFGVKIALRELFDNANVAVLARRIDGAQEAEPIATELPAVGQQVVTFHPGGPQTPFLYFHNDVWFDGMYCRRLAAITSPDMPFVAIAPHGTAGLPRLHSIEAMAHDFYGRVRAIQPHGPYRIGGSCAGGLIAYELARMLHAHGETVERLVMVNASLPPRRAVLFGDTLVRRIGLYAKLDPQVREKFCWNAVRFFDALGTSPRAAAAFVQRRLQVLISRKRGDARALATEPDPFDKRSGTPETESHFATLVAAYTYHPKPYDGEIILVMGADYAADAVDPTLGWGPLTRGVHIKGIPSGFLLPLHENIAALGGVLRDVLAP